MINVYSYSQLRDSGFTGDAWNVYYEFAIGDDIWGHDGETADELDAFFKTFDDAIQFADLSFPDGVMEEKLVGNLAGDAEKVVLTIEQCIWQDGALVVGVEYYYRAYEKQPDGSIVKDDSTWPSR